MPAGLPSADEILTHKVRFFSLDTNIIQAKGYEFAKGALHILQHQRPAWMSIQLTEIVEREVMAHRLGAVKDADQKLAAAIKHLRRKAAFDVSKVEAEVQSLAIIESATTHFEQEIKDFVENLGGGILLIDGPTLGREMFERYFATLPPFEVIKDKKSEFPDVAALLVLKQFAKQEATKGMLVSSDGGWAAFANASEHLYCVSSLESFTALFESMDADAALVETKVREKLNDTTSDIYEQMEASIHDHVADASWTVGDLYSGYSMRLEGHAHNADVVSITPDYDSIQSWFTEDDPSLYVVEVSVSISVEISVTVEFYQWDSEDRDEFNAGSQDCSVPMDIEVSVFMTSTGELVAKPVEAWSTEFEIASGDYTVDVGEVNPDYGEDEEE